MDGAASKRPVHTNIILNYSVLYHHNINTSSDESRHQIKFEIQDNTNYSYVTDETKQHYKQSYLYKFRDGFQKYLQDHFELAFLNNAARSYDEGWEFGKQRRPRSGFCYKRIKRPDDSYYDAWVLGWVTATEETALKIQNWIWPQSVTQDQTVDSICKYLESGDFFDNTDTGQSITGKCEFGVADDTGNYRVEVTYTLNNPNTQAKRRSLFGGGAGSSLGREPVSGGLNFSFLRW